MKTLALATSLLLATNLPVQCLAISTKAPTDLSWIQSFTAPVGSSEQGRENELHTDPRFAPLLRASFRQHQFFWHDHGQFTSLPDLVQLFIGVPGKAILEQQRFAVLDGCVPHSCGVRGMLWIDTQSRKHPALIFVAIDNVNGSPSDQGRMVHLWLFSSTRLNWQNLPPSFTASMAEWWANTSKIWEKYYKERVAIVSLVQPSGEIVTLSPSLFSLNTQPPEPQR